MRAAAEQVQRLYERGAISYPRSASRVISPGARAVLARLLPRGLRHEPEPGADSEPSPQAHEAIHPLPAEARRLPLEIPEWMLDGDDRTVHRLTRHWLRCLSPIRVDRPETDHLPEWARGLAWARPAAGTSKAMRFEEEATRVSASVTYPPAEIAFRALLAADLGRPSSQVEHAEHAAERGWIHHGRLSSVGRAVLEAAPAVLADPGTSHAIEETLDSGAHGMSALALAEKALSARPGLAPLLPLLRATLVPAEPAASGPSTRDRWMEEQEEATRERAARRRAADLAMEAWIEEAPELSKPDGSVPPAHSPPAKPDVVDEPPCHPSPTPSIR